MAGQTEKGKVWKRTCCSGSFNLHARNIAPIMPGTLETRAPEEDDSVVVRTGVQVCVNNILRDLKNTSSYTEQLNKHVQSSDKCRNEYSVLINTHTMGEAIEELVSEQTIYGAPIFNNPNVVNSMAVSWKVNDLLGKKVEETPTTPPNASRMDTTFVIESRRFDIFTLNNQQLVNEEVYEKKENENVTHMSNNMEKLHNSESPQLVENQFVQEEEVFDDIHLATGTPLSRGEGSNTITRTRGNMIRPKQRSTIGHKQWDKLRSRLQQFKFGK
ncbi:hypothetical protein CRE_25626 [Caenorhabditis remanei]|uniref:Uncharacterized protein n=1 Tax=Caenorhabditis remanei TaxID=31234 RepID=E3ML33_CAERE|nr:hypothetical protein CRE_25626 [Caenorhabditis remanei]